MLRPLILSGLLATPILAASLKHQSGLIDDSKAVASPLQCRSSSGQCPEIASISWGEIVVKDPSTGEAQSFKDAKLWPGGARTWDWRETGTHHKPGTQLADIQELLSSDPDVVIVSRGMNEALQVAPDLQKTMKEARSSDGFVTYLELPSDQIAKRYAELQKSGLRVAAVIHSTC